MHWVAWAVQFCVGLAGHPGDSASHAVPCGVVTAHWPPLQYAVGRQANTGLFPHEQAGGGAAHPEPPPAGGGAGHAPPLAPALPPESPGAPLAPAPAPLPAAPAVALWPALPAAPAW